MDKVGQSVRQGHGEPSHESSVHCTGTEESFGVKALERLGRGRVRTASVVLERRHLGSQHLELRCRGR